MFKILKNIDFLSPPITLFHLERRTHTSNVGGFLVILMLSISTLYISFLFYDLYNHKSIISIFHKKFEYEAGYYSFNSSSIFHFIQIYSPDSGGFFDKYESKYIRAFTTYVHSNFTYNDLYLYDHWVFDNCRKNIDDKGLDPELFNNVENFTNGVCIRYYYNSSERKYYSLEEPEKFSWPHLEHGISQRNNIYLTTIVQKCSNDSIMNEILGDCPSQKEIDDYISKYLAIYLYFTDTQVDPTNYKQPIQKYLQVISTGIGTPQTFVESYIHFSPLRIITKIGSLFRKYYNIDSFYFDFNRKGAANNNEKYFTITKYYHLMQNNVQIYERRYNNIFDMFSEIGGVIQFIFYFFYWINYAYNKYIIAFNASKLLFSVRDNHTFARENQDKQYNIKNNIINIRNIRSISSKQNAFNFKGLGNAKIEKDNLNNKRKLSFIINNNQKLNSNIFFNNRKIKKIQKGRMSTNPNSSNYFLKDSNNNNNVLKNNLKRQNTLFNSFSDIFKKIDMDLGDSNKNFYQKEYENIIDLQNRNIIGMDDKKLKTGRGQVDEIKIINHFSLFNYLKSVLFKNKNNSYYFIRVFRKHLLSEEHLLKCHIKMIFIEKKCSYEGNENTSYLECFNEL